MATIIKDTMQKGLNIPRGSSVVAIPANTRRTYAEEQAEVKFKMSCGTIASFIMPMADAIEKGFVEISHSFELEEGANNE